MVHHKRILAVLSLALALMLIAVYAVGAQQARVLAAAILNGDFEGSFYVYGSGNVAQYWVPYDRGLGASPPQFLRATLQKHGGEASQQIWSDGGSYYSGILQTTALTSSPGSAQIRAGGTYVVHVWVKSIYGSASAPVQAGKIMKRLGVDPSGGTDPNSTRVIWGFWYGEDKTWVQMNNRQTATGNRITIFIEAKNEKSGGQDQFYIDDVTIEEEGVAPTRTPTRTPTITRTPTVGPTATPTPLIGVVRTIPVGRNPQGIEVMPKSDHFFVANRGDDTISSLEGFFGWHDTRVASGGDEPVDVAVDPGECRMYVANAASSSVSVLNACTDLLIRTIALPSGSAPSAIAVLTTTHMVYVANSASNNVAVIDGNTLTMGPLIPTGPQPRQIAVNPLSGKVYVTTRGSVPTVVGAVTVINSGTQTVLKTINLSTIDPNAEPYGVDVNPRTNRVYVTLPSGKLVIIDGQSDEIITSVPAPVLVALDAVGVNPNSNNVFVSSVGTSLFVYDADWERWSYTVPVGTGAFRGIAVNPLTYNVVVSNPSANTVSVIQDYGTTPLLRAYLPVLRKS